MTYNYKTLLVATGGDADLAQELLTTLLGQIPGTVDEIEKARESNDFGTLRKVAHTLRGPLGTIGDEGTLKMAIQLEAAAVDHDIEQAGQFSEKLQILLNELACQLSIQLEDAPS